MKKKVLVTFLSICLALGAVMSFSVIFASKVKASVTVNNQQFWFTGNEDLGYTVDEQKFAVYEQMDNGSAYGTYSLNVSYTKGAEEYEDGAGVTGEAGIAFKMSLSSNDYPYEDTGTSYFSAVLNYKWGLMQISRVVNGEWIHIHSVSYGDMPTSWQNSFDVDPGEEVKVGLKVVSERDYFTIYVNEHEVYTCSDSFVLNSITGTGFGFRLKYYGTASNFAHSTSTQEFSMDEGARYRQMWTAYNCGIAFTGRTPLIPYGYEPRIFIVPQYYLDGIKTDARFAEAKELFEQTGDYVATFDLANSLNVFELPYKLATPQVVESGNEYVLIGGVKDIQYGNLNRPMLGVFYFTNGTERIYAKMPSNNDKTVSRSMAYVVSGTYVNNYDYETNESYLDDHALDLATTFMENAVKQSLEKTIGKDNLANVDLEKLTYAYTKQNEEKLVEISEEAFATYFDDKLTYTTTVNYVNKGETAVNKAQVNEKLHFYVKITDGTKVKANGGFINTVGVGSETITAYYGKDFMPLNVTINLKDASEVDLVAEDAVYIKSLYTNGKLLDTYSPTSELHDVKLVVSPSGNVIREKVIDYTIDSSENLVYDYEASPNGSGTVQATETGVNGKVTSNQFTITKKLFEVIVKSSSDGTILATPYKTYYGDYVELQNTTNNDYADGTITKHNFTSYSVTTRNSSGGEVEVKDGFVVMPADDIIVEGVYSSANSGQGFNVTQDGNSFSVIGGKTAVFAQTQAKDVTGTYSIDISYNKDNANSYVDGGGSKGEIGLAFRISIPVGVETPYESGVAGLNYFSAVLNFNNGRLQVARVINGSWGKLGEVEIANLDASWQNSFENDDNPTAKLTVVSCVDEFSIYVNDTLAYNYNPADKTNFNSITGTGFGFRMKYTGTASNFNYSLEHPIKYNYVNNDGVYSVNPNADGTYPSAIMVHTDKGTQSGLFSADVTIVKKTTGDFIGASGITFYHAQSGHDYPFEQNGNSYVMATPCPNGPLQIAIYRTTEVDGERKGHFDHITPNAKAFDIWELPFAYQNKWYNTEEGGEYTVNIAVLATSSGFTVYLDGQEVFSYSDQEVLSKLRGTGFGLRSTTKTLTKFTNVTYQDYSEAIVLDFESEVEIPSVLYNVTKNNDLSSYAGEDYPYIYPYPFAGYTTNYVITDLYADAQKTVRVSETDEELTQSQTLYANVRLATDSDLTQNGNSYTSSGQGVAILADSGERVEQITMKMTVTKANGLEQREGGIIFRAEMLGDNVELEQNVRYYSVAIISTSGALQVSATRPGQSFTHLPGELIDLTDLPQRWQDKWGNSSQMDVEITVLDYADRFEVYLDGEYVYTYTYIDTDLIYYNGTGVGVRYKGEDFTFNHLYSGNKKLYALTTSAPANGTVSVQRGFVNSGDTVTISGAPNEGYHLEYYTVNGQSIEGNTFTMPSADTVVSAVYGVNSYTVTINQVTGGTIYANGNSTSFEINYGETVTLSNVATDGYTFDSYIVTGATLNGNSFTMGGGNVTLSANWTPNTYTLTVEHKYGSTLLKTTTEDVRYTESVTVSAETITGYTAQYASKIYIMDTVGGKTVTFDYDINKYVVTWKNHDGTVLETDNNVPYGTTPTYNSGTPTKSSTAQYSYTFSGWSPTVAGITGDTTYTAQFSSTVRTYTVTWKNGNTTLETDTGVAYGTTPTYNGGTPTKASTAQYSYTFSGWSPTVAGITGDTTYTAQFSSTVRTYTVTWKNGNTTLETDTGVAYGTTPTYNGGTPTKASTAQYSYTFSGWSPTVAAISGDTTYTAQFSSTVRTYTVTWKNHDGTVLETDNNVPYGTTPTYNSGTPTKSSTAQYSYTFSGWSPTVAAISGATTYTAQFSSTVRKYTVTVAAGSYGSVDKTSVANVPYGTKLTVNGNKVTINGTTVTATASATTDQYTYGFSSWTNGTATVTGNMTVTANFTRTERSYTLTINRNNTSYGTVSSYSLTAPYSATISVSGAKVSLSNGQSATASATAATGYTTSFSSWSGTTSGTLGTGKTITANFSRTAHTYTVTYNGNGNTGGSTASSSHTYGTAKALTSNGFTKTGYSFAGWATSASGSVVYSNGQSVSNLTATNGGTVNLYAKWNINKYTVTISRNNTGYGTVSASSVANVPYGTKLTVNGNKVTINGTTVTATASATTDQYTYGFSSWTNGTATVTGNMTVTANFTRTERSYTLTINRNNTSYGTVSSYSLTAPYSATISVSGAKVSLSNGQSATASATAATGYTTTFSNWSGTTSGTLGTGKTITANFSRTANTYTLTVYHKAGNTTIATTNQTVTFGQTATVSRASVTGFTHSSSSKTTGTINSTSPTYEYTGYYRSATNAGISPATWVNLPTGSASFSGNGTGYVWDYGNRYANGFYFVSDMYVSAPSTNAFVSFDFKSGDGTNISNAMLLWNNGGADGTNLYLWGNTSTKSSTYVSSGSTVNIKILYDNMNVYFMVNNLLSMVWQNAGDNAADIVLYIENITSIKFTNLGIWGSGDSNYTNALNNLKTRPDIKAYVDYPGSNTGFADASSGRASTVNFSHNSNTAGYAVGSATTVANTTGNYVVETRAKINSITTNGHISINLNGSSTTRFVLGNRNTTSGNYYVGVATGSGATYDSSGGVYIPLGSSKYIIITVYVYNSSNCAVLLINATPVAWIDAGTTISKVTIGAECCSVDFDGSIVSTSSTNNGGVFNAWNSTSTEPQALCLRTMRDKGNRGYYVSGNSSFCYYDVTTSKWSGS